MSVLIGLASVAQSIVLIAASIHGGAKTGTGFAVSSTPTTTQFLTAAHVVEGSAAPVVFIGGPRGRRYTATVVRSDRLRDAALLEIPLGNFPTIALADVEPPVSGTAIEVNGFPTMIEPANGPPPSTSPSPLPLIDLQLVTIEGKVDGESEQGESILLDIPITHGDSGAPITDTKTSRVIGMVLGLAAGYGTARWMSGDGLGLSIAALTAFLGQSNAPVAPAKPAYSVAMVPNPNNDVVASWSQLAASAGFFLSDAGQTDPCRGAAGGTPIANAVVDETGDPTTLSIDVTDCSGTTFYHDGMTIERGGIHDLVRLVGRTFLGYLDTHPAQWASLLKYGIAVDPKANPFLALMSVGRNPFGQLVVTHVFLGGPADLGGLQPNDAILKINGRPTRALADPFITRLLNQPSVTLLATRNEREFTVRLKLRRFEDIISAGPVPH
jgi:S1-C subfamily serine protease